MKKLLLIMVFFLLLANTIYAVDDKIDIWYCDAAVEKDNSRITDPNELIFQKGGKGVVGLCYEGFGRYADPNKEFETRFTLYQGTPGEFRKAEHKIYEDIKHSKPTAGKVYKFTVGLFEREFTPQQWINDGLTQLDWRYDPTKWPFPADDYYTPYFEIREKDEDFFKPFRTKDAEGKDQAFYLKSGEAPKVFHIAGIKPDGGTEHTFTPDEVKTFKLESQVGLTLRLLHPIFDPAKQGFIKVYKADSCPSLLTAGELARMEITLVQDPERFAIITKDEMTNIVGQGTYPTDSFTLVVCQYVPFDTVTRGEKVIAEDKIVIVPPGATPAPPEPGEKRFHILEIVPEKGAKQAYPSDMIKIYALEDSVGFALTVTNISDEKGYIDVHGKDHFVAQEKLESLPVDEKVTFNISKEAIIEKVGQGNYPISKFDIKVSQHKEDETLIADDTITIVPPEAVVAGPKVQELAPVLDDSKLKEKPRCANIFECLAEIGQKLAKDVFKQGS